MVETKEVAPDVYWVRGCGVTHAALKGMHIWRTLCGSYSATFRPVREDEYKNKCKRCLAALNQRLR